MFKKNKCNLIAEIGWNHMGNITLAKKMIRKAKDAGADFCKFQSWGIKNLKSGPWDKDGRLEIYHKAELTKKKHIELINYCKKLKINFLSSAFTIDGAKLLKSLKVNFIKIPSHEVYNLDLISFCLKNFKTVLISAGACKYNEVLKISKLKNFRSKAILMHCVSSYPLEAKNANFVKFNYLKKKFKNIGYSGHLSSIDDALLAISLGAIIVEKHFTTDNNLPGRDNKFALLPHEFKKISIFRRNYNLMMTNRGLNLQKCEKDIYKNYRGRWGK